MAARTTHPSTAGTPDADPYAAAESLRAALDQAGIVLPSLSVEYASPHLNLVELGRVRADVALQLAHALRLGARDAAEGAP